MVENKAASYLEPTQKSGRAFASDQAYLPGIGHRLAALEDSRLLPLVEGDVADTFSEDA